MRNFKKALAAALGFLLCVVLIFGTIVWPYFHGQSFYYEDAQVRDDLAGSLDLLISGASHGACAFDTHTLDAELGVNSYNLSGPLMTMPARKTLLCKELDRNPVKTVIIELSCNALTRDRKAEGPEGDIYALPRMGGFSERARFFFGSFPPEEWLGVGADTLDRGLQAWKARLRGDPPAMDPADKGFLPRDSWDMSMTDREFAEIHGTTAMVTRDRWDNKVPLYDMIQICKDRGIEVILVTAPMSDRMLAQFSGLELSHQWFVFCAETYGCPYLDFNLYRDRDDLFPDETAFFDSYHLSTEGARTFTRELTGLLEKVRAGQDVSALFFDNYDQMDEAMRARYSAP